MNFNHHEFTIGQHFLPYLINGDASGLEDDELALIQEFDDSQPDRGHWDYDSESCEFARCDVTGLHSDCITVRYFF